MSKSIKVCIGEYTVELPPLDNCDAWLLSPGSTDKPAYKIHSDGTVERLYYLKPCPFCGGEAGLTDVRSSGHSFRIGCYNELCVRPATDYYDNKDHVVDLWNRRAPSL